MTGASLCRLIFAIVLVWGFFEESIRGRPLLMSAGRPDPDDAAAFARWLVSQSSWGYSTLYLGNGEVRHSGLIAYARKLYNWSRNVVSFTDGLPSKGTGIPYFYLTALDPTARDALKDQRSSFTLSEYNLGTCVQKDPENPTCAKITLVGKLKLLDQNSKEAESARAALFSKHPEMIGWPTSHNFQVFKLDIGNIFLINWFGGPKPLTVEQYLHLHARESAEH